MSSSLQLAEILTSHKCVQAMSIFSLLSSLALVSVVIRISWLAVRHRLSVNQRKPEFVFFNTQLGRYAACLLAANSFIGAAGLIGIRWVIQKGIAEGLECPCVEKVIYF